MVMASCESNVTKDQNEQETKATITTQAQPLVDGLYLITGIDTIENKLSPLATNETAIFFSKLFDDYNTEEYLRIIIDSTQFVPIQLGQAPTTEQQTDSKKKLLLSFTKSASEKLKVFTANHVMDRVVLVVNGEGLTMHKIREPITSGQLQITRCNDNACEKLFVSLSEDVVSE